MWWNKERILPENEIHKVTEEETYTKYSESFWIRFCWLSFMVACNECVLFCELSCFRAVFSLFLFFFLFVCYNILLAKKNIVKFIRFFGHFTLITPETNRDLLD